MGKTPSLREAQMAELVDAIDSKSIDGNIMRVRFSLWALKLSTSSVRLVLVLSHI